ncbi:MAG TPA: glycosyltransferase [Streptosporangiaceae bacterium]|nr:glycosyltransferase [Streptosporangiaceae bacterium]
MRIVRLDNFITPCSGGLRTALRELGAGYAALGHEPVLVMRGAADHDEQTPQGRVITLRGPVLRRRYAAPGEVLIVHCGRLSVEKRPHRSIDALARLRAAGVPAVLVVAGDGPLRPRLERQAAGAALPVAFTGFIPGRTAVAALLATADVVLAPGPVETFGLAALEALASGTPVVVSGSGALPEVIGGAGVTVTGEDFAGGVLTVLGRPAAQRRAAARAHAERFGWPAAVSGFLAAHAVAARVEMAEETVR